MEDKKINGIVSEEELARVTGGGDEGSVVCDDCGKSFPIGTLLYSYNEKKLCGECYRKKKKGKIMK